MSVYDEFLKDKEELDKKISESNERWKERLRELRRAYWKDPNMRAAILDAEQSLKDLES